MQTKNALIKLYHQIDEANDDAINKHSAARGLRTEITRAAIARKFDELPEMVTAYEIAINDSEMAKKRVANLIEKRNEWGYSSSDLYYYATGNKSYQFGGGEVPVRPAK